MRWLSLISVLALTALLSACGLPASLPTGMASGQTIVAQEDATPVAEVAPRQRVVGGRVIAEGRVVPQQRVTLSMSVQGVISELLVTEGDRVQEGQVLLRLDDAAQRAAVAQAEALVQIERARLQRLEAGATPEQIRVAEVRIQRAQASLNLTKVSVSPGDIAAAQAQVERAQAELKQLQVGATPEAIKQAQSRIAEAEAELVTTRDRLSAEKTKSAIELQKVTSTLVQSQANYAMMKAYWDHVRERGTDPLTGGTLGDAERQRYYTAFVQAEEFLRIAEELVKQEQVNLETARQAEISGIQAAEERVARARVQLDELRRSARPDLVAQARAALVRAQADLENLTSPERQAEVAVAETNVAEAEALMAVLKADPSPSDLAIAQAELRSAEANLEVARAALESRVLRAPFAGTIAVLNLRQGEYTNDGAAILQLIDTSAWLIETADLSEVSIVRISEGQPVLLTFSALPGLELSGKVTAIRSLGDVRQGDVTYRVTIMPDQQDARLRWNMTTLVTFEAQP